MVSQIVGRRIVVYIERRELERRGVDSPEKIRAAIQAAAGRPVYNLELFTGVNELIAIAEFLNKESQL